MRRRLAVRVFLVIVMFFAAPHAPTSAAADESQSSGSMESKSAYPIPGDRWLEIDLYWFEQRTFPGRSTHFGNAFSRFSRVWKVIAESS
jgi:hypothetical protein